MYTIANNVEYELVIKNSKFITYLYKVDNEDVIKDILIDIKKMYPDATHHCYGYILENIKKANDDNEPTGTAGIPILTVLDNNNLTNILAIVIRYFGGIKLGAGGLVRAYTKSVANAIKETKLKKIIDGINIDIVFTYEESKQVDYLLRDVKINKKEYTKDITYNLDIPISFLDNIKSLNIKYKINKYIKIEE